MSSDCLKSPTNAEGLSLESPPDVLETGRVWPRWLARLLAVVTVFLVPWTLWLTFSLPTRNVTHHYDVAWVGFDIALAAMFAATAVAAIRSSVWLQPLAAVTGTMLVCDAWFDVVTSASRDEQFVAVLEAGEPSPAS